MKSNIKSILLVLFIFVLAVSVVLIIAGNYLLKFFNIKKRRI